MPDVKHFQGVFPWSYVRVFFGVLTGKDTSDPPDGKQLHLTVTQQRL